MFDSQFTGHGMRTERRVDVRDRFGEHETLEASVVGTAQGRVDGDLGCEAGHQQVRTTGGPELRFERAGVEPVDALGDVRDRLLRRGTQ